MGKMCLYNASVLLLDHDLKVYKFEMHPDNALVSGGGGLVWFGFFSSFFFLAKNHWKSDYLRGFKAFCFREFGFSFFHFPWEKVMHFPT